VTDVFKNIVWNLFVLYRRLYLELFLADICIIFISIAVELNYLMLSKSYRNLEPYIYILP